MTHASPQDADDLTAEVTSATPGRRSDGSNRTTLAAAELPAVTPDDNSDRFVIDSTDYTWTAVGLAGGAITDVFTGWAWLPSPTSAQLLPLNQTSPRPTART